ncbi:E3 ubiquitin/ISG15 ligase TRIM25-like [Cheilinus undulatus]|uniref:E3 ubiquitin/ISG15 ligase TRIM25-like n=1 Tax=Cheilinus undulatus TaxID=241271 RepID=UPI001BD23992|nr:E3 ubiquitin/ISG15 ligase TRIM25-like [Cheilinus undulatus]
MAQTGVQLDQERMSCSICLDLFKNPATVPCGHSYCLGCIKTHWDKENMRGIYSCPQCRQTFKPRPILGKNTLLADLVDDVKKNQLQAAASHCYAGPEDVACDVCPGRKRKASKSCLQCLVSYCQEDLRLHHEAPAFKKHVLMEPSKKLQENICSQHDELMKIFCRSDQELICYLCLLEEHKDHDTVSAVTESTERLRQIVAHQQIIQQRIQTRGDHIKMLDQELRSINLSADKTLERSAKTLAGLIHLLERRYSNLNEQIRSRHGTEVSRMKGLKKKLAKEIKELRTRDAELQDLIHTEDHIQFLQECPSLSQLSETTDSSAHIHPQSHFEDLTADMMKLQNKLQDVLTLTETNIPQIVTQVDRPLLQPEPKTRDQFLQYAIDLTIDPNTANWNLALSPGGKGVCYERDALPLTCHPERFNLLPQALSKESLTGRCYWEMTWRGRGVCVAVAYKQNKRVETADAPGFGLDGSSWALSCCNQKYDFCSSNKVTPLRGPWSTRVGVYLDRSAGVLAFYSISGTLTLLHRIQTTFTQPLYAGLMLPKGFYGTTAEFCTLK